ncbi:MAG: DUF2318 domain-containing protein [Acidobacteria bacterium]|nr:DUF2318 domain-containing protein [Acidobacteriota bacterium]
MGKKKHREKDHLPPHGANDAPWGPRLPPHGAHDAPWGPRLEGRHAFANTRQAARRRPPWGLVLVGAGFAVLVATLVFRSTRSPASLLARADIETLPAGRDVTLAASTFDDGRARFYRYATSIGRDILFFVMKSSDGVVRAAFDACDVCYRERKGYRQSGDLMICNNCERAFRSVDINVLQGGCNPAPIERGVEAGQILLKAADLDLGAAYF